MQAWLETLGVLMLAGAGSAAAWWFSRRPGRGWMWGYVVPLLPLLVILAAGYSANLNRRLEFQVPFALLMGGRVVFATLAFVAAIILTSPLLKLPRSRERRLVAFLLGWFVCQICAWPFLAPIYHKAELAKLTTNRS